MSDAMMSGSGNPVTGPMAAMPAEPAVTPGAPIPRHGEAALPGQETTSLQRVPPVEAVPMAPATGRVHPTAPATVVRGVPTGGMLLVGVLTLLLGAWAGIAVFVGPTFGWSPDGSGAWTWNLVRAVVHAVPGIAAFLAAVLMISAAPGRIAGRGRSEAMLGGFIALLAGAWLVIGPSAWPLFNAGGAPLSANTGLLGFSYVVGANLGPGVLLAALGAMAMAWAMHSPRMAAAPPMAAVSPMV